MTRATFVRHGHSTGNAGHPTPDLVAMPLTPLGTSQAREVACSWHRQPTHIVSLPLLRARQMAEPMLQHGLQAPCNAKRVERLDAGWPTSPTRLDAAAPQRAMGL